MDVEKEFRRVLVESGVPAPVFLDVPEANAPNRSIAGADGRRAPASTWRTRHASTVAVQCWGGTRATRGSFSTRFQMRCLRIGYENGAIGAATLDGGYRFDDIESKTPRYQAVVRLAW